LRRATTETISEEDQDAVDVEQVDLDSMDERYIGAGATISTSGGVGVGPHHSKKFFSFGGREHFGSSTNTLGTKQYKGAYNQPSVETILSGAQGTQHRSGAQTFD